jgi:hypothetical protein
MTLCHPQSGQEVRIGHMQLRQLCQLCGDDLQGQWGMATADGLGWTCLAHHARRTLGLKMTPELVARAQAREQLAGASAGDSVPLTPQMLEALGVGEAA